MPADPHPDTTLALIDAVQELSLLVGILDGPPFSDVGHAAGRIYATCRALRARFPQPPAPSKDKPDER